RRGAQDLRHEATIVSADELGEPFMKRMKRTKTASVGKGPGRQSMRPVVEPLLPVPIPHTTARLARGIRARRWTFATGQVGADYATGVDSNAQDQLNAESPYKRESRKLFRNLGEVLTEAGAGFSDVVRIDQYYSAERAMHPYHEVRHEVFGKSIPP